MHAPQVAQRTSSIIKLIPDYYPLALNALSDHKVAEWMCTLVVHKQYLLTDPQRKKSHGKIWQMRWLRKKVVIPGCATSDRILIKNSQKSLYIPVKISRCSVQLQVIISQLLFIFGNNQFSNMLRTELPKTVASWKKNGLHIFAGHNTKNVNIFRITLVYIIAWGCSVSQIQISDLFTLLLIWSVALSEKVSLSMKLSSYIFNFIFSNTHVFFFSCLPIFPDAVSICNNCSVYSLSTISFHIYLTLSILSLFACTILCLLQLLIYGDTM